MALLQPQLYVPATWPDLVLTRYLGRVQDELRTFCSVGKFFLSAKNDQDMSKGQGGQPGMPTDQISTNLKIKGGSCHEDWKIML
jgi:hypothetical protein